MEKKTTYRGTASIKGDTVGVGINIDQGPKNYARLRERMLVSALIDVDH